MLNRTEMIDTNESLSYLPLLEIFLCAFFVLWYGRRFRKVPGPRFLDNSCLSQHECHANEETTQPPLDLHESGPTHSTGLDRPSRPGLRRRNRFTTKAEYQGEAARAADGKEVHQRVDRASEEETLSRHSGLTKKSLSTPTLRDRRNSLELSTSKFADKPLFTPARRDRRYSLESYSSRLADQSLFTPARRNRKNSLELSIKKRFNVHILRLYQVGDASRNKCRSKHLIRKVVLYDSDSSRTRDYDDPDLTPTAEFP